MNDRLVKIKVFAVVGCRCNYVEREREWGREGI